MSGKVCPAASPVSPALVFWDHAAIYFLFSMSASQFSEESMPVLCIPFDKPTPTTGLESTDIY